MRRPHATVLFFMILGVGVWLVPVIPAQGSMKPSAPCLTTQQPDQQEPQRSDKPQTPDQQPAVPKAATELHHSPAQTYTGKIVSNKGRLVLKNDAGPGMYKLDGQTKASEYKGKNVIVTGSLDSANKTIHVLYIVPGNTSPKTKPSTK